MLVKKPMDAKKIKNKMSMAFVISGQQDFKGGMDQNQLKLLLGNHIESWLQVFLGKTMEGRFNYQKIEKLAKLCIGHAINLAALSIVSRPRMEIIEPKKGKPFNPELYEDASADYEIKVKKIKRPGLMCSADNRVFTRASVTTTLTKFDNK